MNHLLFESLTQFDHILWDWNGTIIDDAQAVWRTNNKLLDLYNKTPVNFFEHSRRISFPIKGFYEAIGFDFSLIAYEKLAEEFHRLYEIEFQELRPFDQTEEILRALKNAGKSLYILSAAETSAVERGLERFGLSTYFDYIAAAEHNLGSGKIDIGLSMLDRFGWDKQKTILVGDTLHDLEVGQAMGIEVLLVGDGHQDPGDLMKAHDRVLSSRFG